MYTEANALVLAQEGERERAKTLSGVFVCLCLCLSVSRCVFIYFSRSPFLGLFAVGIFAWEFPLILFFPHTSVKNWYSTLPYVQDEVEKQISNGSKNAFRANGKCVKV